MSTETRTVEFEDRQVEELVRELVIGKTLPNAVIFLRLKKRR